MLVGVYSERGTGADSESESRGALQQSLNHAAPGAGRFSLTHFTLSLCQVCGRGPRAIFFLSYYFLKNSSY